MIVASLAGAADRAARTPARRIWPIGLAPPSWEHGSAPTSWAAICSRACCTAAASRSAWWSPSCCWWRPIGLGGRQRRRLSGRSGRSRADARDRRVPGVSAAGAGAGIRRRAEARHHQCDHRHRADGLAALCAAGAGGDADGAPHRLHRRGAADRRLGRRASSCATSCRCA